MKLKMLLLAAAAACATSAMATPITYTFTGNFTGTVDGNALTASAVFTGVGDTDNITTNGFSNYMQLNSLSAVWDGTTYNVAEPTFFYINSSGYAGLEFGAFDDTSYFSGQNNSLLGYDGVSNVGSAIVYFDGINASILTDQGAVNITAATDGTFAASVGGAVPEPASWALMAGGFALAGAAMRARRKAAVTFA